MKTEDKMILLYSGGMDSYIAWEWYGRPQTLYVNLGHRYIKKELKAIADTIPKTLVATCTVIGQYEKEDAEIPNRNLLLAMFAALEGADYIGLVIQKDEMSIPDRTAYFLIQTSDMLSRLNGRPIMVGTPFQYMDKTSMVEWYVRKGFSVKELLKTVGCYSSDDGHCGKCGACFRRYVALRNNDIDPGYEISDAIKQEYKTKLYEYSPERQERMKRWL